MVQAQKIGCGAKLLAALAAVGTFLMTLVAISGLWPKLGLAPTRGFGKLVGGGSLLVGWWAFAVVNQRFAECAQRAGEQRTMPSGDAQRSTPHAAQPLALEMAARFGEADEAQQLVIVGQLAQLAGAFTPEQLARLALRAWAGPHASVREAAYWQVRGLAQRDGVWGLDLLHWAYREALHNPQFLAAVPNPGDQVRWLHYVTQDGAANEQWRRGDHQQGAGLAVATAS